MWIPKTDDNSEDATELPYKCINGQRKWNPEFKARYEELTATTFATTPLKYEVKYVGEKSNLGVAHSSSGRGHRPLKAEITGSNPVCATIFSK